MTTRVQLWAAWRTLCQAWLATLLLGALGHPAALASQRELTVLVVYSSSRLLPANIEGDRGFRQAVRSTTERPVLIVDEYLDLPRLGGPAYEQTLRTYLHDKYAPRPPDLVVAAGDTALVFLLANRAQLFPGAAHGAHGRDWHPPSATPRRCRLMWSACRTNWTSPPTSNRHCACILGRAAW